MNILYNGNVSNICLGILKYDLTDHLPLFIILDIENQKIKMFNKIKNKNKITILIIKIIYSILKITLKNKLVIYNNTLFELFYWVII